MSLNIHVIKDKILSENYFLLRNMTYELTRRDGSVVRHKREVYDRGNGATVLLYNPNKQSVVLVRQKPAPDCWITTRQRYVSARRRLRRPAMRSARRARSSNSICRPAA